MTNTRRSRGFYLYCIAGLLFLLALGVPRASADSITFAFDPVSTFSGTAPAGSLTATSTDVAGGVQLMITSNLAWGENLDPGKALYLNVNPSLDSLLSGLSFTLQSNVGFSLAANVHTGGDGFKADGDGYYDILFTYAPSTKALTTGESQTYLISTLSGTITADDFLFLSTPGGGAGTWLAAVHVQNTPSGGSGSAFVGAANETSVPEPASIALFGSGLIGLAAMIRRRRKQW